MKELLESLSKAKEEIQPIIKNSTNPFFKSGYADINALLLEIEPILHTHGLILVQPIENDKVSSKIYHVKTGQVLESSMTLPNLQDPQKMGSAVTYYRRYTLQSLLALQAKDDDGNHAAKPDKITRDVNADIVKGLVDKMNGFKTIKEVADCYTTLSPELKRNKTILELKEKLKNTLK
jgi:hypothetical protein